LSSDSDENILRFWCRRFCEAQDGIASEKSATTLTSFEAQRQIDTLVDVTNKLGEARLEAGGLNDKLLLYLIDAAIFHANEALEKQSDLGEHEKWS
jgi:hypothetical protein